MLAQPYQLEQTHNIVVVEVGAAQFDMNLMYEILEDLMQRMRCDNAVYFVFDVSQVEFIGSACVGLLVQFLQDVEHVRGRIALAGCRPNVALLFKITKLDLVFTLYDDVDGAKAGIVNG